MENLTTPKRGEMLWLLLLPLGWFFAFWAMSLFLGCSRPVTIPTSRTLRAHLDPDLGEFQASYLAALDFYNNEVGCMVIAPASPGERASIIVRSGANDDGAEAGSYHGRTLDGYTDEVRIAAPGDVIQAYVMIAHELGHILGLQHGAMADGFNGWVNVMAPNAAATLTLMGKWDTNIHLTNGDRAFLGALFCREGK